MKDLLKFITCGSVDDGKSTLIGHMLYDAKLIFADQKRALELDSKVGSTGGGIDYSLLLDGLMAEREQGITIDVAYRYFSTKNRSFIVADTPGHEEYTRNMAVGASFADCAVILLDATKGILEQTKRHTRICYMFGIKDFVFAVNKMDLVDFSKAVYENIRNSINEMCKDYTLNTIEIIPVSATTGDNVTNKSKNISWYQGKPLLEYLETIDTYNNNVLSGFYLPIQRVCRPNRTFRGFQGEIERGSICVGDSISVFPSNEVAKVSDIIVDCKSTQNANKGDAVTICLDREIDISRGCVVTKEYSPIVGNSFAAEVLWTDDTPLKKGSSFIMHISTQEIPVVVTNIKYIINNTNGNHEEKESVDKNEIALCELITTQNIVFDIFDNSNNLGAFILINRVTHATSACGMIRYALELDGKAVQQKFKLNRTDKELLVGHKALTIWMTGLSCSGKSTIANALEIELHNNGIHTIVLDGDNIRLGLCKDLKFSKEDRTENIRRVAEVAKLLNDAGIVVITSLISPLQSDRDMAKNILRESYIEVFVDTDLSVCEQRDVKGLYKKARRGEIKEFTGISSEYEIPKKPNIIIKNNNADLSLIVKGLYKSIYSKLYK